jgi:ParB/RepB/Spo0J family partition protein
MNFSKIKSALKDTHTRTDGISPYVELELSTVYPNPNQPRKEFKNIAELAETIAEYGLLQPIVVERRSDGHMIISGERRYRAHLLLKARTIKAYVMASSDNAIQELALIENIQREDLSDFEIAKFIGTLWASGKYDQKSDLARALGKKPPYISKAFSCLKLDESIIADLESAKHDIGLSVLEEIGRFKDKETQREVYAKYIAGEIKRDDFVCFKPEAKVSRGKTHRNPSKLISVIVIESGSIAAEMVSKADLSTDKKYKIIIEEL